MASIALYFPSPLPYNRPWKGVPLSLLAISRVLDQQGYQIHIFARFLQKRTFAQVFHTIKTQHPICLGISAMTGFQIYDGLKLARQVKKRYPNLPIVWGGWHPSILPQETLNDANVDIVIKGQGDLTFPSVVKALQSKRSLRHIPGIAYKTPKGIHQNPDAPAVNLDLLPPLPYHLVDVEKCISATEYGQRTLPYISSYGCPHRCGFCVEEVVNKRKWTAISADKMFAEWQFLINHYHIDSFAVYDSNFFVNEDRTARFCQLLLDHHLNIRWGNANGRVGQLSRYKLSTWRLMQKSGCAMILTGAESGSQSALDFINKDMNVSEIIKFTRLCHRFKIKILYSFLVGLPWSKDPRENQKFVNQEFHDTLSLIDKLLTISNRNRYTYYIFLPYPGAQMYHRALSLGFKSPHSLSGWSKFLMSPEDAFHTTLRQKWITPFQARTTAMLTQYIFGLMDQDTHDLLLSRINKPLFRLLFRLAYSIGLCMAKIRWRYKFFRLPFDYWIFTQVHKYGQLH